MVKRVNGLHMSNIDEEGTVGGMSPRSSLGAGDRDEAFKKEKGRRGGSGASALADALRTSMGITVGGSPGGKTDGIVVGGVSMEEDDGGGGGGEDYAGWGDERERYISSDQRLNSTDSQVGIPQFRLTSVDGGSPSGGRRQIFKQVFRGLDGKGDKDGQEQA